MWQDTEQQELLHILGENLRTVWWYLEKLKMLTSYGHQSCAHYIPQRNSCSGTLRNVCNNIHSSPRIAKTNLETNDICIATEMTKTKRRYLRLVEYYMAVKNEIPLYQMVWINHNFTSPRRLCIVWYHCRCSKITISKQITLNKKFKMGATAESSLGTEWEIP